MEVFFQGGHGISGLTSDDDGSVYVCSSESGDVLRVTDDGSGGGPAYDVFINTGGVPRSVAFSSTGSAYFCDLAHQAVLMIGGAAEDGGGDGGGVFSIVVKDFDAKALLGPSSCCVDAAGTIFFTDSGPVGGSSLASPGGSVFRVDAQTQMLLPLALNCLALPSAIALSPAESVLYVAETMANRVLRFVQQPAGVYHFTVFAQFAGGLGPAALAVAADGNVYVARADIRTAEGAVGVVDVLSPRGVLLASVEAPDGVCELAGLAITADGRVLVSDKQSNTIYSFPVV